MKNSQIIIFIQSIEQPNLSVAIAVGDTRRRAIIGRFAAQYMAQYIPQSSSSSQDEPALEMPTASA